jgi:hypothetical protein
LAELTFGTPVALASATFDMIREQHLRWCRRRAMGHARAGLLGIAVISVVNDLDANEQTRIDPNSALAEACIDALLAAARNDFSGVCSFIHKATSECQMN